MNPVIIDSLKRLDSYIRDQQFKGYDPYDALNAPVIKNIQNKVVKLLLTQFFVYSPLNLRLFFRIKPEINPNGIGLLLRAYCTMYRAGLIDKDDFDQISSRLVDILLETRSQGYSGFCWGFPFDWQDLIRYAPQKTPTIVISSIVGQGFLDLYDVTKEDKYLRIAESITEFMLKDLHITSLKNGICFSYTPLDMHVVHNANCLGAAFLTRVHSINHNETLLDHAKKAFDFSISCQRNDGSWTYRLNPETGEERIQIDFHQGFIIDSLCDYIKYSGTNDETYMMSLEKAALFYKNNQFQPDGRAKWRLPRKYPVDIHHLAQGILSFSKMYEITKKAEYLNSANTIAQWTITNMQNEKGFFYYQKWPLFTNKIDYMRWGQAWMMFSLSKFIHQLIRGES
jgi:rhamnogalacturonyl hydrolase YesR